MLNVNSAIVSGKIIHAASDGNGMLLVITQKVYNLFDTKFYIFLAEDVVMEYRDSGVKIGDEILVTAAVMYEKEGQMRYRVTSFEQIKKITPTKEDMMLGRESAKEKFM